MPAVLIRYRVKSKQVEQHLELLADLYDELAVIRPAGLQQATYRLADDVSFVELVAGPDLPQPLPQVPAFRRYRDGLEDRCDEPPVMEHLREVGSFGMG